MNVHAFCVLECEPGRVLTKRFDAAGKHGFTAGKFFRVHDGMAESWDDFRESLTQLTHLPTCCLIRGVPVDDCPRAGDEGEWVYRRVKDRRCEPANFRSVAQPWIVYDFDDTAAAFDVSDPAGSVCAWHASLPDELRCAESAFFLSASAHASATVRGKLAVWYREPISEARARALARHYRADPSVTGAVQPNYFGSPIFEGVPDPLADWRHTPIVFAGLPAGAPTLADVRAARNVTSPVKLADVPLGDAGIVAALGDHTLHVGRRFAMCGAIGGLMRRYRFAPEECAAIIRAWLPPGDRAVDVERGVRWALGAWDSDADAVSGRGVLLELVGEEHANVIDAAMQGARAGKMRPVKKGWWLP